MNFSVEMWPNFSLIPTKKKLEALLDDFLAKNKHFQGIVKVGKSYLETILPPPSTDEKYYPPRYEATDEYETLGINNVLCLCSSERLALDIEKLVQQIMSQRGLLIPQSELSEGGLSGKDLTFIVYITKKKPIEDMCPICEFYYEEEQKKYHMMWTHIFEIEEIRKYVSQLNGNDKEEMRRKEKLMSFFKWSHFEAEKKENDKPKVSSKLILKRKIPETKIIDKLTSSSSSSTHKITTHPTSSSEDEIIKPKKAKKMTIIDIDEEKEISQPKNQHRKFTFNDYLL